MKLIFKTAFLLLFPAQVFGQLQGYFCSSQIFSSSCINFLNQREFEFNYSDCTRQGKGKGTYSIDRKKLILRFSEPKPPATKCGFNIKATESQSDSVTISVYTYDKSNHVPLPFVNNLFKSYDGKIVAGQTSDEYGKSTFSFKKSTDSVSLLTNYVFYEKCVIPVTLNKNQEINIGLISGPIEWIVPGTVWTWKLSSITEDKFILKGKDKSTFKKID